MVIGTIIFLLLLFGLPVYFAIDESIRMSRTTFKLQKYFYNQKGAVSGVILVESNTSEVLVQCQQVEPDNETLVHLMNLLQETFDKELPWEALLTSIKNGSSREYSSVVTSKRVILKCGSNTSWAFHFPKRPSTHSHHRKLRRAIEKLFEKGALSPQTATETSVQDKSDIEKLKESAQNFANTHEKEMASALNSLYELLQTTLSMPFRDSTNVRQIFNVHLGRLNAMIDIFKNMPVAQQTEARDEIISIATLLSETLLDFHAGQKHSGTNTLSSIATSIRSMIESGK